ncbi:hypothetical protein ACIPSA_38280 [Streptomyces sp. NPDC086549]|uniref:hypothetical protein n=1 Tax=Streptomyces sp. NPDC086549 TaxID=3365752 RepID=UPI00380B89F8
MNPDASAAVSDPRILIVPQTSRGYGGLSKECRATARDCPQIRSITHIVDHTVTFAVQRPDAVPLPGGLAWEEEADTEGRPGRGLVRWVLRIDHAMQELDTGELMRTLVVTAGGGIQCSRLHSGQYLVGISESGAGCAPMDEAMNRMVSKIRQERHLTDELPGGRPGEVIEPFVAESPLLMQVLTRDAEEEHRLRAIWHRHLNPTDLHYAAYYRNWSLVCVGDTFDHQELDDTFGRVTAPARRARYRDLVCRLQNELDTLGSIIEPVTRDPVRRLVLDVVEGAFYMHWLDGAEGEFVVGVTFRQPKVAVAEQRLRKLVKEVRAPR